MEQIFGKPLITQQEIEKRVRELGIKITADYEGRDPVMICILKGAFAFFADLVRNIRLPIKVDFMMVFSYGAGMQSSGKVKIISDLSASIRGKDVIIVEDIIDSGLTMSYLLSRLKAKGPKSLKVCVLLDKVERRKYKVQLDYVGFAIPNEYVIGYGLDYKGKYRNLPYVAILDMADIE